MQNTGVFRVKSEICRVTPEVIREAERLALAMFSTFPRVKC